MNKLLSTLAGQKVDESIIEQGFIGSSQQNAGCFIRIQDLYSISDGVVLAVERDSRTGYWTVTVEVDSQHWVRYCCLAATSVNAGDDVKISDNIGYSYKNLMRLEYCTSEASDFPVRVINRQLYKQDPTPIIFGGL